MYKRQEFIRVFEEEARKLDGIDFLGQGTIYPDICLEGLKKFGMSFVDKFCLLYTSAS